MKITKRHWTGVSTVAVVAALVWLVMRPRPLAVEVAAVERGSLLVTVDEDGEARVRDRYVIASPVTGRLLRPPLEAGAWVDAGAVVARVQPLPLDSRTRSEAAARLQAAEASWRAALAALSQAQEVRGEAERMVHRLESVDSTAPGAITAQRLDQARTAERSAALAVDQARGAAEAAEHQVESARAALGGSGDAAREATLLRAPAAGRVLRVFEPDERTIAAGTPVLELGDPGDLEVVVDVLSEDAHELHPGAKVLVTWAAATDTVVGRVDRIEPSAFTKVSPLGVEEQRVNVVVGFASPLPLGDRYRVDASLVVWHADDVLRVPVSALFRLDGGWAVFVAEGGRARQRTIEIGHRNARFAEVLEGLAAGETVLVYPAGEVEDGVRVEEEG
jgi:HlyD family secretion protein